MSQPVGRTPASLARNPWGPYRIGMAQERSISANAPDSTPTEPSDEFLVASIVSGDAAALRALMRRFDRLVRYTVFRSSQTRCGQDPEFLESVASATWEGFVRSIRRDDGFSAKSISAYLARVARNQTVSALRKVASRQDQDAISYEEAESGEPVSADDPPELLARIESLEALRGCIELLSDDDRTLTSQLGLITERRWKEAAALLKVSESTLRSRWKRVLDRLRTCVEQKTGESLAPKPDRSD